MEITIKHQISLGLVQLEEMIELFLEDNKIEMSKELIERFAEHLYDCIEYKMS